MCYLDTEKKYMWEGIGQDVLPFLAKNQFKTKLGQLLEEALQNKNKTKNIKKQEKHAHFGDQLD